MQNVQDNHKYGKDQKDQEHNKDHRKDVNINTKKMEIFA
jgi:hypothetical protein